MVSWETPSGVVRSAVCVILGVGLMAAGVSPVWAAPDPGEGGGSWPVGGFGLGDGIEGLVEERSGALSFVLPAGGVSLGWDSRSAAADRYGFGAGWTIGGAGFVDVVGGVRVVSADGEIREAAASVPSGLAGYTLADRRFEQTPGLLTGRADGLTGDRAYAFRLVQLGGMVSYFDAAGDPIAWEDRFGNRADWEWAEDADHRLTTVITEEGVVTTLDWSDPARVAVTTRAGAQATEWVIEMEDGRVAGAVDPLGGRTSVGYTPAGLVSQLTSVSGAATEVSWHRLSDGAVAVDRVRVTDSVTGERFSERAWEPGVGSASGWPVAHVPGRSGPAGDAFSTVLSDGAIRVESEYSGRHALLNRKMVVSGTSGGRVIQEQAFEYPEGDGNGLPAQADRPEKAIFTHWNVSGDSRVVEERYRFDDLGRVIVRTAADRTVTETEYDDEAGEHGLPVGLPLVERSVASDGLVSESRYEVNSARTSVIADETFAGTTGEPLSRVDRTEYDVADDGFVTTERAYPQGGAGEPVATVHDRLIDVGAGRLTLTETVAAGTELAGTTTTVCDLLHGLPLATTDVMGNLTITAYDALGRVVRVEDAAGRVGTTEYRNRQQHGMNATVATSPADVVTTTETDVLGRTVRTTDNIDRGVATPGHERVVESRAYPDPGVVEVTDAWGATTRSEHDALGRPVATTTPSMLTEVTVYDEAAETQTSGLTPTGALADAELVTTSRTSEVDRVATLTGTRRDDVSVLPSMTSWDGFGRETFAADAGRTSRTEFDALGNPVTSTITPDAVADTDAADPGRGALRVARAFDAFGASVQKTLTDETGSRSAGTRELDLLGRTTSEVDPAGTTTAYDYTADGLVAQVRTSSGQLTVHTYDPTTRDLVETVTTSPVGEAVRTSFEYDPVTGALLTVFDPDDRDGTAIRYESDAWGNSTAVTYPDGSEIRYGHDRHGRGEWVEDAAGVRTRSVYAASGELTGVTQAGPADAPVADVDYEYDAYGRVATVSRGNGTATTYAYTSRSEIASERTTEPSGAVSAERVYAYSPTGTLATRTDTARNPDTGATEATTTAYRYDGFDRLVGSTVHDGPTTESPVRRRVEYVLTVSGDLTRESTTESTGDREDVTVREYGYTAAGQLTTITTTHPDGSVTVAAQEYDRAGNLVLRHDGTTYAYDAQNRPISETTPEGETLRTGYWATGQRRHLSALDPSTGQERQTRFYWDDTTLLAETHRTASGHSSASYLLGVMRHARSTGPDAASTVYYGFDRHGNVTDLTDAAGTLTTRYEYDDYGARPTASDASEASAALLVGDVAHQPFGYAGEHTDPTGTQRLQVRTYDPGTRRFHQLDLADQHNPYWFGNANPITHVDPAGQAAERDWLGLALAGLGLAASFVGLGWAAGAAWAAKMAVGGWAGILFGTKLALGATFSLAVIDTGLTSALAWDHFKEQIFDEDLSRELGIVAVVAGAAGFMTGGVKAFGAPRTLPEALQQNMTVTELSLWRLTYTSVGRRRVYVDMRIGDTPFAGMEGTTFGRYLIALKGERAPLELKSMGPGALKVVRVEGADGAGPTYMVQNPRYRAKHSDVTEKYLRANSGHEVIDLSDDPYKAYKLSAEQLSDYMQTHGIYVLYVKPIKLSTEYSKVPKGHLLFKRPSAEQYAQHKRRLASAPLAKNTSDGKYD